MEPGTRNATGAQGASGGTNAETFGRDRPAARRNEHRHMSPDPE